MSTPQAKFRKDYTPADFTIDAIALDIHLDDHHTRVHSTLSVKRQAGAATRLVLDAVAMDIGAVLVDGKAVDFVHQDETLSFTLDQDEAQIETQVVIDPANNTLLEGLYKSGSAYCTQCEAEGFRRITPFLDRPDVLALYTTSITASKSDYPYLLSNGNKTRSETLEGDLQKVTWVDPFPKPSYLFALVAGDFDLLEDTYTTGSGKEVKLEIFVDKGNLSRAPFAMTSLKKAMQWDEEKFGLEYDLDIYMIVAVDFFNMGAMENKGLNVFNSRFVLADEASATDDDFYNIESVIGHEYFHNWTGNRVTCRDWFQLSLKEGLTVYRDQAFSADMDSAVVGRIKAVNVLRTHQFAEDSGPMAHPIRPDKVIEMNNFYTVTVYDKGAEVIRMMATLLGETGFRKGMDLYFERHDGQAVTCDDFVAAMQDANNKDLSVFSRWYSQSGTPELTVSDSWEKGVYELSLSQMTPATKDQSDKQPLHIPVDIELITPQGEAITLGNGNTHQVLELKSTSASFTFNTQVKPVPVLLRNFSAPVKLHFDYAVNELGVIARYASDDFSRFDAIQTLYRRYIVSAEPDEEALEQVVIVMSSLLGETITQPDVIAEMLKVPEFTAVTEFVDKIDPQALHGRITGLKQQVSLRLNAELEKAISVAESHCQGDNASAWRSLKNTCLSLWARTYEEAGKVLLERFHQSQNMTDCLAVMQVATSSAMPCFDEMADAFATRWESDGLVMDKWFAMQSRWPLDDVYHRIEAARQQKAFDGKNPNRVRALYGALCHFNVAQFHRQDGKGYQCLASLLLDLDKVNPQVASRLITPLLGYKRYLAPYGEMMKSALMTLQSGNLSADLYEKVSLALED